MDAINIELREHKDLTDKIQNKCNFKYYRISVIQMIKIMKNNGYLEEQNLSMRIKSNGKNGVISLCLVLLYWVFVWKEKIFNLKDTIFKPKNFLF